MSEDLEEKCIPCDECQGYGDTPCIDLTEEEPSGFTIPCEACWGHKCFIPKKVVTDVMTHIIHGEPYHGECNGHCGHFRDKESYLKSLENKR